jgi:hypothetical protein
MAGGRTWGEDGLGGRVSFHLASIRTAILSSDHGEALRFIFSRLD